MPKPTDNVEEIFNAAVELEDPAQREQYLDEACGQQKQLRRIMDSLLRSHERAGEFMEQPPELPVAPTSNADSLDPEKTRQPANADSGHGHIVPAGFPRRFGDYELLSKISQGGMGVIYKARQISLNRIVAVKMILSGQFASPDEVQRFQIEAEAAGKLDHPGIVPVFDVGCIDGKNYFAMAFIEGTSLAAVIPDGAMEPLDAAALIRQIALAIQVAHDNGIVHRDLKPGNILLDQNRRPRVTDFGLAKQVEGDSELTTTGMVMGTPSYMPPEQAEGLAIDFYADIYSLGAILYALLTGQPPFQGDTQVDTLIQVIHNEPVPPRKQIPTIPKDLELICLKCLEKSKTDRYHSAGELADDLENFLSGEPISARNDLLRRLRKWTIRESVLAAQLTSTAAIMLLVLVNFLVLGPLIGNYEENRILFLWYEFILFVSGLTAFVLQKLQNRLHTRYVIPFVWAISNPLFLTSALVISAEPRGALYSLYLLLLITISFGRRVELVVATTASSVVGYTLLLFVFSAGLPDNITYELAFGLTLICAGALSAFLTYRLQKLGQQNRNSRVGGISQQGIKAW